MVLPATVHAALVALLVALLRWAAESVGIDVDNDTLNQLATLIVAYILSLGALGVLRSATTRHGAVGPFDEYHPPFT